MTFDGSGDVKAFVTKVELVATIKGYEGEKFAAAIASRLEGPALDLYLRLSTEDRKSADRIKEELLKEYERGNRDREEALSELSSRRRKDAEAAQTFAFKIQELVRLAYPGFTVAAQETISKYFYMKELHTDMLLAIKSIPTFSTADLKTLIDETSRLELAGVRSVTTKKVICAIDETQAQSETDNANHQANLVKEITETVMKQLTDQGINSVSTNKVNNETARRQNQFNRRKNNRYNKGRPSSNQNTYPCRNCNSTNHLVRFCPVRFCQACGNRGHDSWDKSCPKYL